MSLFPFATDSTRGEFFMTHKGKGMNKFNNGYKQ